MKKKEKPTLPLYNKYKPQDFFNLPQKKKVYCILAKQCTTRILPFNVFYSSNIKPVNNIYKQNLSQFYTVGNIPSAVDHVQYQQTSLYDFDMALPQQRLAFPCHIASQLFQIKAFFHEMDGKQMILQDRSHLIQLVYQSITNKKTPRHYQPRPKSKVTNKTNFIFPNFICTYMQLQLIYALNITITST